MDECQRLRDRITELERAEAEHGKTEEALRGLVRKWRSVFDAVSDAIFIIGPDGKILECNEGMTKLLGRPSQEIIGGTCWQLMHGITGPIHGCPSERARKTRVRESLVLPVGGRWFNLIAEPVLDGSGGVSGIVHIMSDITEQKKTEEELSERARQAALGAEIGMALTGGTDLRSMLQRSTEALVKHLDAAFARIWTLNEKDDVLELQASAGMYTHIDGPHGRVPVGKFKIGLIALERKPHLTNAVIGDPRIGDPEWVKREGMVAFAGHPLVVADRLVGVMALFSRKPLRDTTLAALASIADEVALGIEHKRSEEALGKSESRYRTLAEAAQDIIFVINRDDRIEYVNHFGAALFGLQPEAMIGGPREALFPGVSESERSQLRDVFETGLPHYYEERSSFPKSELWLSTLLVPVRDEKGGVASVMGISRDITVRKETEEFLRESEQKLRSITDTASDAIILIDEEEKIVYWNASAGRMFGHGADEVMGKHLFLIMPERYREMHAKAFRRFVETGTGPMLGKTYEAHALRKDGSEFPIDLSISGIRLKGRLHAAGIIRDISERKKLEAQLLHSQKMEAVGQLAGGVAHDFNNILTAIIGYGHMLHMKMKKDDPLRVNVEHMLESADRAAHLTHSLLAFSRKQIINPMHVDLNEIIRRVEKFLRRIIGEDIELRTALSRDALTINADSSQIEQVLMNLATNARDAMPRGGAFTLETSQAELDNAFIRAHGYGEPGRYAVVSATDTGHGMDETTRRRIFEPFFTTKEVGRGTGLGLSILYGIVKQHQGYINVYSEPGKGTTFRIYLPLFSEEGICRTPAADASEECLSRGTETVLIAEDDETLRRLSRTVLEEFGYSVIEAEDGEEAVARFREHQDRIGLVIIDMIMPKKSGRETYDELRRIRPEVKAFFVSGYTADKIHSEGLLDEGVDLLMKPVYPRELLKKVRELLDR